MANIQLVRLAPAIEETLANHPEYIPALIHDNWPRVAELVHEVIGRTLIHTPISVDELQWGGYFVVDEGTGEVVGSCAYKKPPTEDGIVEIAYFTFPGFERRGYATAVATEADTVGGCLAGRPPCHRPHAAANEPLNTRAPESRDDEYR